jgi:hypothetical protein
VLVSYRGSLVAAASPALVILLYGKITYVLNDK